MDEQILNQIFQTILDLLEIGTKLELLSNSAFLRVDWFFCVKVSGNNNDINNINRTGYEGIIMKSD